MAEITLLDGSIGQEAVRRGGDAPTPLWSTKVMMTRPGLLAGVHADYARAGATIATANSYALHRDRLAPEGLEDRLEELIALALREAREGARGQRVAGALGPLGASYRPDLVPPPDRAAPLYAEIAGMMAGAADLLIAETVPSVAAAEGVLLGARATALPVWLAMTVEDDDGTRLRSGEPLADLRPVVARHAPEAVLINCSRPEAVEAALTILAGWGRPFGAYANGFTHIPDEFLSDRPTVAMLTARRDLDPAAYARFAMGWVAQGATIVGGCCEVGPAHIGALAEALRAAGHRIV
ncbi:homocysteine S-methyltransferase [Rhodosalinus halophilus]|uniref:Homocysteine S-methyltransferase n=1 Tax=Rhodosalinus halophilus TaxID=2259333 RepID=A0A365U9Z7_9RHOB|nr:homocysteine S-methyltransferase family protein [Rhodosalinus halophilus]RBI85862.1 homocysteine S-methyltransferase [Rhodosalinus halophilus]